MMYGRKLLDFQPKLTNKFPFQGHQMSSQELMENYLNGKDINEIEFHPSNLVKSTESNEIIPAKDDLNISGVTETISSPVHTDDNKDQTDFMPIIPNEQDPMNMSFYEDKDAPNNEFNLNPFDLNKVHRIPDEESDDNDESSVEKEVTDEKQVDLEESETAKSPVELLKSPILELPSPSMETTSPGPLSPKSPILELSGLVSPEVTASIKDENIVEDSNSPAFSQHSTATPVDNLINSPETEHEVEIHHQPDNKSFADHLSGPYHLIENSENISEKIESDARSEDEIKQDIENELEGHAISLENVVKEVERDTASFIEEACKTSDNLNYNHEIILERRENIQSEFDNVAKEPIENVIPTSTNQFEGELQDQLSNIEEVHSEIEDLKGTLDFIEHTEPKDEMRLIEDEISQIVEDAHREAEFSAKSPEFYPEDNEAVNLIQNEVDDDDKDFEMVEAASELIETKSNENKMAELNIEHVDVKRETITPEYAVPTLTSPSEESKELDTPESSVVSFCSFPLKIILCRTIRDVRFVVFMCTDIKTYQMIINDVINFLF